jgi:hypothetical protein
MHIKTTIWHKLFFLIAVLFFSAPALANCPEACEVERSKCQEASSEDQKARCEEKFNVCTLNCNREETQYCAYLGFKNHDGVADKEKELSEITGGFARVTDEEHPHFAGLCRSNNMKCIYVMEWDKTMLYCGGANRDPRRVACCR